MDTNILLQLIRAIECLGVPARRRLPQRGLVDVDRLSRTRTLVSADSPNVDSPRTDSPYSGTSSAADSPGAGSPVANSPSVDSPYSGTPPAAGSPIADLSSADSPYSGTLRHRLATLDDSPATSAIRICKLSLFIFIYIRTCYAFKTYPSIGSNYKANHAVAYKPLRDYITLIRIGFGFVCCLFTSVEVVRRVTKRPTLSPGSTAGIASLTPGKRLMLEVCLLMKRYA
jgi:hypothetical protein